MVPISLGDMSRTIPLGRQSARLKDSIATLSNQMTTGQARDKLHHLNGNVSYLAALEQSLERAANRKDLAQTTATFLAAQQSIVAELGKTTRQVSADSQLLELTIDAAAIERFMREMSTAFSDAVRFLNTSFGDRTLFAGTRGDGPALADPDAIIAALVADIPVPVDPATLPDLIEAWFAPGGGFDNHGYAGGRSIPGAIDLGHGVVIRLTVTAQDSAVRETLATLATGAVLGRGIPGVDGTAQRAILLQSTLPLKAASQGLVDLSARLGVVEERAVIASSRAEAERTGLSIALADLLAVDPYESASKLEQAMNQLDTIYMITARLSRLSLADYLR